jgi:hypothetical protein
MAEPARTAHIAGIGGLQAEKRAGGVDREQPVPCRERLLDQRRDVDDAGVVDEHVEARAVSDQRIPSSRVADVEAPVADVQPDGAEAFGGLLTGGIEDIEADHGRAFAGEAFDVRRALAACTPGDDGHAPVEATGDHRKALPPVAVSVSPVT